MEFSSAPVVNNRLGDSMDNLGGRNTKGVLFASKPTVIQDKPIKFKGKGQRPRSVSPHAMILANQQAAVSNGETVVSLDTNRKNRKTKKEKFPLTLSLFQNGEIDLTDTNIEAVVNSDLSEDRKIELMEAMCNVEENKTDQEMHLKSHYSKHNGVTSPDKTQLNKSSHINAKLYSNNVKDVDSDSSPELNGARPKSRHIQRIGAVKIRENVQNRHSAVIPPSYKHESTAELRHNKAKTMAVNDSKTKAKLQAADIQAWIDRQKMGSIDTDRSVSSDVASSSGTDGLDECKAKLEITVANR
jgi:hypothetical protein